MAAVCSHQRGSYYFHQPHRWRLQDESATATGSTNPDKPAKPVQILDIADAYRIVSEVTKIVKRIEDIRSQDAVSRPELFRILHEMGRGVMLEVQDQAVIERIKQRWGAIRL